MYRQNYILLIPCLLVLTIQLIAMDNEHLALNTSEDDISLKNTTKYTLRVFKREDTYRCDQYTKCTVIENPTLAEKIYYYFFPPIISTKTESVLTTEYELCFITSGQSRVFKTDRFDSNQMNERRIFTLCVRKENGEALEPSLVSISSAHPGTYEIIEDDNHVFRILKID